MLFDLRDFVVLARDASMATTYKPALLKSITRIVSRNPETAISLVDIGAEFVRLYWNQTVVFHLRQAPALSKEPRVLSTIRLTAAKHSVRKLADLPQGSRALLERKMVGILRTNVLNAFHSSKPAGALRLFDWDEASDQVSLSPGAVTFIKSNAMALELLANYWWASYLEKVNVLAPFIIQKVQSDGARRGSLTKMLHILTSIDEPACFYCGRTFSDETSVHVDHVLPWSFLLSDPIWDLVMTCSSCNLLKSDRLPSRDYIEKLQQTNVRRATSGLPLGKLSPLIDGAELAQLYDAALAVEWPGPWTPSLSVL